MAHFVAKKLSKRPNEILDGWGCAELLVAYGQYANEDAAESCEIWDTHYGNKKGMTPRRPPQYVVEFIDG